MKTYKGPYFFGIEPIHFIWHNNWTDPEIEYNGIRYNYHDVIAPLWEEFTQDHSDTDCYGFAVWLNNNKDIVFDLLADMEYNWRETTKEKIKEAAANWMETEAGKMRYDIDHDLSVTFPMVTLLNEHVGVHTVLMTIDLDDNLLEIPVCGFVDHKHVYKETFTHDELIRWLKATSYGEMIALCGL